MGFPTKVQLIRRKASEPYYISVPYEKGDLIAQAVMRISNELPRPWLRGKCESPHAGVDR